MFYAELSDTYSKSDLSEFASSFVIPLLSNENVLTKNELAIQLKQWIESFDSAVCLASDNYKWDWPFVLELFDNENWPANLSKECKLLNINYMNDADAYYETVQKAYEAGLRKHHALDDAKANRLGWKASEGSN